MINRSQRLGQRMAGYDLFMRRGLSQTIWMTACTVRRRAHGYPISNSQENNRTKR